jgi:hypothetical protein
LIASLSVSFKTDPNSKSRAFQGARSDWITAFRPFHKNGQEQHPSLSIHAGKGHFKTYVELGAKAGVIVLTNTNDSNPADFAQKLNFSLGKAVGNAGNKAQAPNWDPAWENFAGLYRTQGRDQQVVVMNKKADAEHARCPLFRHAHSAGAIGR